MMKNSFHLEGTKATISTERLIFRSLKDGVALCYGGKIMTQGLPKLITFNEFSEWYPNDGKCYELHKGVIVEMPPPTGAHEKVVGFIAHKLTVEFDRLNLPYTIPKTDF